MIIILTIIELESVASIQQTLILVGKRHPQQAKFVIIKP